MEEFNTVRELHKAGKLEVRLRFRLIILAIISVFYGGFVAYDVLFKGLDWMIAFWFAAISFIAGFFILTRMFLLRWDEEKEIIRIGRIDIITIILLGANIYLHFHAGPVIATFYKNTITITGATYAIFFGLMFGHLIGTLTRMTRLHRKNSLVK